MKIAYNWLKEYIKTSLSPEKMSEVLTNCGLEVEKIEKVETVKGGLAGIVIGKVLTCAAHPDADKLYVTTVDIGTGNPLQIVCGAPNVAAGQTVPVATMGAVMHFGDEPFTIKKTKLRGVVSEGMICAEDELGLGTSHAGIMVLDDTLAAGTPAKDYFNSKEDYVFEIGLTPNRSDATSHIGVARDVCAVLNRFEYEQTKTVTSRLHLPDVSTFMAQNNTRPIAIEIKNPEACKRYMGLTISNISVKESPEWMKDRLNSIGLRPINNLVDISNFVLMETGQPLHFFDADKITGDKIIIRMAEENQSFVTLDGIKRTLSANDLMICNAEEPMVIAGVYGGLNSGVTPATKTVFIESAWFDPSTIRKTARRHALQTDASFRYERGADIEMLPYAMKRAALLIQEIAGGVIASEIIDAYPSPIPRKQVTVHYAHIFDLIGEIIDGDLMKQILTSLEIKILKETEHTLTLEVPTAKTEVTREADIVEEILRIYGYNPIKIPHEIRAALSSEERPNPEKVKNHAAAYLTANGFYEIMNNSLTNSSYYKNVPALDPAAQVNILNPLSNELNILRQTLLFGGLEVIAYNQNRKNSDLKLYEFGNTYHLNTEVAKEANVREKYSESAILALFMTGKFTAQSWYDESRPASFFDLKSYLFTLLKKTGTDPEKIKEIPSEQPWFSEGIDILIRKKRLASIGILAGTFQKQFGIQNPVLYAEIAWNLLIQQIPSGNIQMKPIPKFPEVRRDLALMVDKSISYREILEVVKQNGGSLVKKVNLFDVYEGDKLEAGKKSYAISLHLQDSERTLTEHVIDKTVNKLIQAFETKINAVIR
ncbi:MAG: phenylalanine--tRNA ligase subunit beta [Bacteroidales bacterium]|nr:phenylalanine--tRNA ligase subunit beta [Bacteroidales bacterium]